MQLLVIIEKQGPSLRVQELGISSCCSTVSHHTQLEAQSPWCMFLHSIARTPKGTQEEKGCCSISREKWVSAWC